MFLGSLTTALSTTAMVLNTSATVLNTSAAINATTAVHETAYKSHLCSFVSTALLCTSRKLPHRVACVKKKCAEKTTATVLNPTAAANATAAARTTETVHKTASTSHRYGGVTTGL